MKLLDRLRDRRDKRRQQAPEVLPPRQEAATGEAGHSLPAPPEPRNRAEFRFQTIRVRRLAGKIEMRHEGQRRHNHRTARWQRRALRYLDGHWADKPGRVAR